MEEHKKLDSLLKRKKVLQSIKDSQLRSSKRQREVKSETTSPEDTSRKERGPAENKTNKITRKLSVITNSSGDDTYMIPGTSSCTLQGLSDKSEFDESKKKINIVSILSKPNGSETFTPLSLLMESKQDISVAAKTSPQNKSPTTPQSRSFDNYDRDVMIPAPTTPQATSSLCVAPEDTYDFNLTLPAPMTHQVSPSLCVAPKNTDDRDVTLQAPNTPQMSPSFCVTPEETLDRDVMLPAPTSYQASPSLCVAPEDTYERDVTLLAPNTPQMSPSLCVAAEDTHNRDMMLPALHSPQVSPSLCVAPKNTHDSDVTLPAPTNPQATPSVCVVDEDIQYCDVILTTSTTHQAISSHCVEPVSTYDVLLPASTPQTTPFISLPRDGTDNTKRNYADVELLQRDFPSSSGDCIVQHRRKKRKVVKKSYIDFLSEDDEEPFSAGSSDCWTANESDESVDSDNKMKKKKRSKKKTEKIEDMPKKEKRTNKYKLNKKMRDSGKTYENRKGEIKEGKTVQPNPCVPGKCNRKCYDITEDKRKSLHNFYWSLDSQRQKDWVVRSSRAVPVDRKRTDSPHSRRTITYEYYINDGEDRRQVCQKFLLSTLDITQKYLLYTVSHSREGMAQTEQRKRTAASKYSESAKLFVVEFIGKLPAVPSHYNRKNSSRVYLSQELKNISNLYQIYKRDCQKENKEIVSEKVFREQFNEKFSHVSFHIPKKDKCVHCTKAENQNLEENEQNKLELHIQEKKATYKRFQAHQNINTINMKTVTASFDLQKVLNTPHGESMLLYYSRKYAVYNFTVYESGTQEGYCYTWGESDGKRGSNEIASCLFLYLKAVDEKGVQNLLLYCDSCSGQNKNKTVLAALNYYLTTSKNLQVIQINFLLPGHTYMPADSMHATIEREVKKLIVWSPSQWATHFEAARKRPKPYTVTVMDHSDFLNWEEVTSKTFTKETLKNIRWKEMRIATFKKKNLDQMEVKYTMIENGEIHTIQLFQNDKPKGKGKGKGKGKRKSETVECAGEEKERFKQIMSLNLQPLYQNQLPIPTAKYNDLKRLCNNGTVPKRFHAEYLQLPFESQVVETLLDTDEEDESDTVD